jgi:tRNA(Ile)-lysidine synthase
VKPHYPRKLERDEENMPAATALKSLLLASWEQHKAVISKFINSKLCNDVKLDNDTGYLNNNSNYPLGKPEIVVGFSGGIDSCALLHALNQIQDRAGFSLAAIHINHGISPNSSHWEQFCTKFCATLGIPLTVFNYTITKSGGESLENNARKARHRAFSQHQGLIIALAHHQNDQAETILSQILRGSDLHNVGGMSALDYKFNKILWRPLLKISRSIVVDYQRQLGFDYVEDESNQDNRFLRNFIRNQLLPDIIKWDNSALAKITNIGHQIQQTMQFMDDIASADLAESYINDCNATATTLYISVTRFSRLSPKRQHNLISYFIKQQQLPLPSHKQIIEFCRQASTSDYDKKPCLILDNTHQLIKHKDQIYIMLYSN